MTVSNVPPNALERIRAADEVLRNGVVLRTPLLRVRSDHGAGIFVKAENLQPTGSFKIRGATYKISTLTHEQRRRGVVAYSTGNHAQAVAYAAATSKIRAVIVMSEDAPQEKIEATRSYGAEVLFSEPTSNARRLMAETLAASNGLALIPPYDDLDVIAGQGTIGLELLGQMPGEDAATVFVPIGGGGLISGIAAAIKSTRPKWRVIGVEPALENDAWLSHRGGTKIALAAASATIADAIRVQTLGDITYDFIRRYVDDVVLVDEDEIASAVTLAMERCRIILEPSGAVALAAVLKNDDSASGAEPVIAIGSGGNLSRVALRTYA